MERKSSIWTKDFILICLASLFTNITMRMLDSNLASYASETWNSLSIGGQLTSWFNAGSILMAFFAGRLIDMKGRRNMLIVFSIVFAVPTIAMALIPNPGISMGVRLVQGAAKGVITVGMASVVSDITPRNQMNEGMGMFNLGNTISFAIGPMLGLALVDEGGYKLMFIVCALIYALAALVVWPIRYEKKTNSQGKNHNAVKSDQSQYKGVWKLIEKNALIVSIINTIYFGGYACILVFLTVYSQTVLKYSSSQISLYYTSAAAAMFAIRILTAKTADKYGALSLIVPGHIVMIVALLLLAFPAKNSYFAFILSGVCYGLGMAVVTPTMNAVAVIDSPVDRGAVANATFYFLMDFGILFASAGFGKLMDAALTIEEGYMETFLISAGILAFSCIACMLLLNGRAREKRREKFHVEL